MDTVRGRICISGEKNRPNIGMKARLRANCRWKIIERCQGILQLLPVAYRRFTAAMRCIGWLLVGTLLISVGCATSRSSKEPAKPAGNNLIVTPGHELTGRVSLVNTSSRYAIVAFPIGALPATGSVLGVYRDGLKVGELKVNGPQMDNLITADLVTGDCGAGDEVRTQ